MMMLHCFFGLEIQADGVSLTPPMPAESSLVLTHCALTGTQPGAVTLYAQSHDQPARFALCTLDAGRDMFYAPLHHVFSQKVSFTLVRPSAVKDSDGGEVPTMHLTGYFERSEEEYPEDDEYDTDDETVEDNDGTTGGARDAKGASKARNGPNKSKLQNQQKLAEGNRQVSGEKRKRGE
uniref:Uncharacterized protein TCIL3000_8_860 n=1 Tax=Trypanosoma congolense (strain IL3000) TaxID=1068625 RepID=G0UR66_TRYCI|nr:unnamed protein product [Trypanosoma congolense IL3000]